MHLCIYRDDDTLMPSQWPGAGMRFYSYTAIHQQREGGSCSIVQFPYKPGGGICPHRGKHDARLVYIRHGHGDETPVQFIAFGGLQGAEQTLEQEIGQVTKVIVAPDMLNPFNQPRH